MAIIGLGILKGMGVTFKTLLETYGWGRVILRTLGIKPAHGIFTVEYPEKKIEPAERFRYFPFLVYDKDKEDMRCVACKICEVECPPQCIHIVMEKDEQGRPKKVHGRTLPAVFDIDVSVCMSCKICVDVCPFDAIEMDNDYEVSSTADRFKNFIYDRDQLLKSADYFEKIKPEEAGVVNERLEKKNKAAQAKKAAAAAAAAAKPKETPPAQPPQQEQPPKPPEDSQGQAS